MIIKYKLSLHWILGGQDVIFEAQDGNKLLFLMIAGAAFASVGLYLLVKPRSAGSAKIELFGLKFESSSAGLLVFFIGAAFMVIPLFAPERHDVSIQNTGATVDGGDANAQPGQNELQSAEAQIVETEPNDGVGQTNILQPGQTLSGDVRPEDSDWIKILLPEGADPEVNVRVRNLGGGGIWSTFYNASEKRLSAQHSMSGAVNQTIDTGDARLAYVQLSTSSASRVKYEVLTVP